MNLQLVIDHFGVSVASISGVLAARGKRVDLFGVCVLALVTAFGGGTIRDVTLGDVPVFWLKSQWFIGNAVLTAVATFYIARLRESRHVFLVADAFVLAAFTMAGAQKALAFDTTVGAIVFLGVTTGVAGGMMRDVLLGQVPVVFRQDIYLYAGAAFLGAGAFVLTSLIVDAVRWCVLAGFVVTLLARLAGIRWRLSLPLLET
ncbi:MAG: trimeric intracellular cation channel family protein [Acidobacteria bacterium]|nr:trimeric intracellular cation channel family protein [Acidobacteriota bacterium]